MFKRIKTGIIDWALREERYAKHTEALLASMLADEMSEVSTDMTATEYARCEQMLDQVNKRRALVIKEEERERAIAWAIKEEAIARYSPESSYEPSSYTGYSGRRSRSSTSTSRYRSGTSSSSSRTSSSSVAMSTSSSISSSISSSTF